jgi:hypothetical protein
MNHFENPSNDVVIPPLGRDEEVEVYLSRLTPEQRALVELPPMEWDEEVEDYLSRLSPEQRALNDARTRADKAARKEQYDVEAAEAESVLNELLPGEGMAFVEKVRTLSDKDQARIMEALETLMEGY